MAKIWTLIIKGPGRAENGLTRARVSAEQATKKSHHIFVYDNSRLNVGIGKAQHEAQLAALSDPEMLYFAKLDDDASLPAGAWDDLIACIGHAIKHGLKVGAAMARPPGVEPLVLSRMDGVVIPKRGFHSLHTKDGLAWTVCDMVGGGATIYTRGALEDGCMADPAYFAAGVDIDIAWNMVDRGYVSLLCDPPCSYHFHAEVSSPSYDATRYAVKHRMTAARRFEKKWGLGVRFA